MSRSNKRTATSKAAPAAIERPVMPRPERPRHIPSEAFQNALLAEIKGMVADIEQVRIAPSHVLLVELGGVLRDALNMLYSKKLIEVGNTLNDRWIKPSSHDAETE